MAQFDESKHPRDGCGKFTDKNGNNSYRQNTDYKEIVKNDNLKRKKLENKFNSDLSSKPKKSQHLELPKKEYAQMCSIIRTRYTNAIPNKGGIFFDNSYYRFKYIKSKEQILCINKIKIDGNEEIIKQMEKNKNE